MPLQLEEFLEFLGPDDIRIKGHRIGIETVIYAFQEGQSPEEIVMTYPTLSLQEVYAVITYYLLNQAEVDAYLQRLDTWSEQMQRQLAKDEVPVVERLQKIQRNLRAAMLHSPA